VSSRLAWLARGQFGSGLEAGTDGPQEPTGRQEAIGAQEATELPRRSMQSGCPHVRPEPRQTLPQEHRAARAASQ